MASNTIRDKHYSNYINLALKIQDAERLSELEKSANTWQKRFRAIETVGNWLGDKYNNSFQNTSFFQYFKNQAEVSESKFLEAYDVKQNIDAFKQKRFDAWIAYMKIK